MFNTPLLVSKILLLGSKSFRSLTPPKVRFLWPIKVLRAQKSFFGPQKTQKIDFFSKRAYPINYPKPRTCYTNGIRTSCAQISLGHQLSKFCL